LEGPLPLPSQVDNNLPWGFPPPWLGLLPYQLMKGSLALQFPLCNLLMSLSLILLPPQQSPRDRGLAAILDAPPWLDEGQLPATFTEQVRKACRWRVLPLLVSLLTEMPPRESSFVFCVLHILWGQQCYSVFPRALFS
jgi:hypothetical protein